MKKALSIFLALLMIFGASAIGLTGIEARAVYDDLQQEGYFVFGVTDGEAEITDYIDVNSTDAIVIPESLGGYPVTSIAAEAFRSCMCTSITISSTVEEIDPEAFAYDMPNLEEYVVDENNSRYYSEGDGIIYEDLAGYPIIVAYPKNPSVTTLKLTHSLCVIVGAYAFSEVANIEELTLSSYGIIVDSYAFYGMKDLAKLVFDCGYRVNYIGDGAFAQCTSLTDVTLSNNITSMGFNIFEETPFFENGCDEDGVLYYDNYLIDSKAEADKKYYEIKDGTELIAGGAFNWDSLTEVYIPASVTVIAGNPFTLCENLTDITLESGGNFYVGDDGVLFNDDKDTLISYPNGIYNTCYVIPSGTKNVGLRALYNSPVKNVFVPASVGEICEAGLGGENVTDIHFAGTESEWDEVVKVRLSCVEEKCATEAAEIHFESTSTADHTVVSETETKAVCSCGYGIEIEEGVKYTQNGFTFSVTDGEATLYGVPEGVSKMTIPASFSGCPVTVIAGNAFAYNDTVTEVILPETLTTISGNAFFDCDALKSIDIPDGVVKISSNAFKSCDSLEYVNIGSGLSSFGSYVFFESTAIKSFNVDSENPYYSSDENGVLYTKDKTKIVNYPVGSEAESFIVPEGVTVIGKEAFYACQNLKKVTFSSTVTTVDEHAFMTSYSLEKVVLNDGLTTIEADAFSNTGITEIEVPQSVTYFGDGCFSVTPIEKFVTPERIEFFPDSLFIFCRSLKSIYIPASVADFGHQTFDSNPLTDIYYGGTEEEWNDIICCDCVYGTCMDEINAATIHYNHVHSYSEEITVEATPESNGVKTLTCVCGKSYTEEFEYVKETVIKSEDYDVSASYAEGCFDEEVSLDVAEIEGDREPGGVYMVDGAYYKQVGLYNIKAVNADDVTVQPNEGYKVTIRLAIPEAYLSKTDFIIYHRFVGGGREQLSTAGGTVTVENGYLVFEVSSFSEFEVFLPSSSIKITKLPAKTAYTYKTEDIDLTGIKLTLTSEDGSTKVISDPSVLTVTGFDNTKVGTQTVTVRYGRYTANMEVKVSYAWWQQIIRILLLGVIWY